MQLPTDTAPAANPANRYLVKGLITGGLILLMLIPSFFLQSLVRERQSAREAAVTEVSKKWAGEQLVSAPFLVIPYADTAIVGGKIYPSPKQLIVTAARSQTKASLRPELRSRSIYKVLLYQADISCDAVFQPVFPAQIDMSKLDLTGAKLCVSLTDSKGITSEVVASTGSGYIAMQSGVPVTDFGRSGLTAPVSITADQLSRGYRVSMNMKLKGSSRIQFLPAAGNAFYEVSSPWNDPSFDGNVLPAARSVSEKGFTASWSFNRANMTLPAIFMSGTDIDESAAFGVSLLQPADQYDKTLRSIKYAILFIGLTFALFFIIEILQQKPFHPVQYVLAGLALTIFYSLLLSLSEFIQFDLAYAIAAFATVSLISLYAKAHFGSWKSGLIFFIFLSALYVFIFVLIRLEDTALLAGSIGLFVILAAVMYASRKVDWYGNKVRVQQTA